jgi:hypothetical protein
MSELIFYDFEFEDTGSIIVPISLGVVSTNKELYLVNSDYQWSQCGKEWLIDWVKPYVETDEATYASKKLWGAIVESWLDEIGGLTKENPKHKLVGYYADYDHVVMAQLWGEMILLPCEMPMWTRDLMQWMNDLDLKVQDIPIPQEGEHNALYDARWIKQAYEWLTQNYIHPAWSKTNDWRNNL